MPRVHLSGPVARGRSSSFLAALVCVALVVTGVPAAAQIPTEFTNLELLPTEIERGELIGIMRGWAGSLGVRCTYCHVGPDNLEGMDFASDEKPTKRTARRMLEMSRQINRESLDALPTVEGSHQIVSCYTCHRGQSKPPRNALRIFESAIETGGVGAAISEYERLAAEHSDSGHYDLSAKMFERVARRRLEARKPEEAVKLLEFAVQKFPRSAETHAVLGLAQMEMGHHGQARASFLVALSIDPELEMARQAISQLPQ